MDEKTVTRILDSNNNMNPIGLEVVICGFHLSSSIVGLSPEQGQVTERERKEKVKKEAKREKAEKYERYRGAVAEWASRQTCDPEVRGSNFCSDHSLKIVTVLVTAC